MIGHAAVKCFSTTGQERGFFVDMEAHRINDAIRLDFMDLIEDLWVVADVTYSVILFAKCFNVTVKLVLLLNYIVTCVETSHSEWASSTTRSVIQTSRGFSLKQIIFESHVKAKKHLWYKTFQCYMCFH